MKQNNAVDTNSGNSKVSLEYVETRNNESQVPKGVVIWLHGLGADCNDFIPLARELKLTHSLKFVFPNAPFRAITINNGGMMRGWYDIRDISNLSNAIDKSGIIHSANQVEELIEFFIKDGFKSEQIVIAGFSQGGVIAYQVALRTKHKLGGVIALSCYLPEISVIDDESINKKTFILACHGKQDLIIPYQAGFAAYSDLRSKGFNISWMNYPMDHGVCMDEIRDISMWLQERFI